MDHLKRLIRDVPDFPKPGIIFKDITPLLAVPGAVAEVIDTLAAPWLGRGIGAVAGIESRGFIFAPLLAQRLACAFVPLRKPGKLPWRCLRRDYQLEYGNASLEIHEDAVGPGQRVLICDDVLATGGTAAAAAALIRDLGADPVAACFVIELAFLGGAARLGVPVQAVLRW